MLNLLFVSFTDCDAFIDLFDFFTCFLLKTFVLRLNGTDGLLYLKHLMTLILFCMLVDALHAHYPTFLLTEEHEILLMDVALGCETAFRG